MGEAKAASTPDWGLVVSLSPYFKWALYKILGKPVTGAVTTLISFRLITGKGAH